MHKLCPFSRAHIFFSSCFKTTYIFQKRTPLPKIIISDGGAQERTEIWAGPDMSNAYER